MKGTTLNSKQERAIWEMRTIIALVVMGVFLMLYLIAGIYTDRAFGGHVPIAEIFGVGFIIIILAVLLLLMRRETP